MRRSHLLLLVLLTIAVLGSVPAAAFARVPQGFVGMVADGPVFPVTAPQIRLTRQLDTMVAGGVESLRIVISWQDSEPYRRWSDVPPSQMGRFENIGGVPMTFAASDRLVKLAAERRLTVLPVVIYTPSWDAAPHPAGTYPPPRSDVPYAIFMSALVHRYGPHGTFWKMQRTVHPVPIRMWQIWNEVNFERFWPIQPFADSYVALVRAAHDAVKLADPGAKIVLGGLPNDSWTYLDEIYKVPGASSVFDVVAAHPYTQYPSGVLQILQLVRGVMDRNGDRRKPILATEVSWPTGLNKATFTYPFNTTQAGQASRLSQLLPLLARNRAQLRLMGFYYYTWVTLEKGGPFGFSGLFGFQNGRIRPKLGYGAFRRAALSIESCRRKAALATRCAQR